jgi:UDP-glucose 4-epimerase
VRAVSAGLPGGGRVLVVGAGSFIAQHLVAAMPAGRVKAVGHGAIDEPGLLQGIGCVVSCCRHPLIGSEQYDFERMDPDLRLARRLGEREIAYLMLSTRRVYAPDLQLIDEGSPLAPSDPYGRHKLAAEEALGAALGQRLTILRLANIFGYERAPGRRTFLSILLDRLAIRDEILFDMSPFVARDFLPVERCAALLARIALAPPGGVLNVGSGIALPTGRLALWILEGYGRGRLVIASPQEKDAFVYDVARLRAAWGEPCTFEDLRAACLAIGRRLAAERAPEA